MFKMSATFSEMSADMSDFVGYRNRNPICRPILAKCQPCYVALFWPTKLYFFRHFGGYVGRHWFFVNFFNFKSDFLPINTINSPTFSSFQD